VREREREREREIFFCCKLGKNVTETFQLLNQACREDWGKGLLDQKKHG